VGNEPRPLRRWSRQGHSTVDPSGLKRESGECVRPSRSGSCSAT
jgi:hypothetical protein